MAQSGEFIFGTQYYRAPTPEPENWEADLRSMKENGFKHVKFWVQWRWSHREENEFYFEDTDRLMDLAYENGLKVTLNVIFDVAPKWFLDRYPESQMVMADGRVVESKVCCYRQIGGFPGTCYNHERAYEERMKFLAETVKHYKDHPAMHMWDVWNEPEQCSPYREAKKETLTCFCDICRDKFKGYLRKKYQTVGKLNTKWGRCYRDFDDIEMPKEPQTFGDFIDFREFHLDTMTAEANSRLRVVREHDRKHPAYMHVVPNTSAIFNALTGVDDFELAKNCDVFASTNFAKPIWSILTLSAGKGKTCYNVECHVGAGTTKMHHRQVTPQGLVKELLPQIGMGIRGFMFWQYRPEILGLESPAWGVRKLDGSQGGVGAAAKEFIDKLQPYIPQIMESIPKQPEVAIWKGRKNEIFSFCVQENMHGFAKSIEAYVDALYENNYNCCIVDDNGVKEGLEGVKLLIMPCCYEADAELMHAVDRFVRNGGMLLCEAHLGGYNADTGRHSYHMPGMGAHEWWGLEEDYTTSSYHLKNIVAAEELDTDQFHGDMKKALEAYGVSGGKYFDVETEFGFKVKGAERFACLKADGARVVGRFGSVPCMVLKQHGEGKILYCGTNLGEGAEANRTGFEQLVIHAAGLAGVQRNTETTESGIHVDVLSDRLIVAHNNTDHAVELELDGAYQGVYRGRKTEQNKVCLDAESAELFVRLP